jgi:hypothetical protein
MLYNLRIASVAAEVMVELCRSMRSAVLSRDTILRAPVTD